MFKANIYASQCLAASGLAVMDSRIAWPLRPDLWSSGQDCACDRWIMTTAEGATRYLAHMDGLGAVHVLARSRDQLEQRLEWITGRRVADVSPAPEKPAQEATNNAQAFAAHMRETERMNTLRALAAQELPTHECHTRREILRARAELGQPA